MEQHLGHERTRTGIETDKNQRTFRTVSDFFWTTASACSVFSLDRRHTLLHLRGHTHIAPDEKASILTIHGKHHPHINRLSQPDGQHAACPHRMCCGSSLRWKEAERDTGHLTRNMSALRQLYRSRSSSPLLYPLLHSRKPHSLVAPMPQPNDEIARSLNLGKFSPIPTELRRRPTDCSHRRLSDSAGSLFADAANVVVCLLSTIVDSQDILTVLNTFSFQRPFPQLRKAQCFPPSQAVKKKEHICILVDQAPLPHVFTPLSPNLAFPLPSELFRSIISRDGNFACVVISTGWMKNIRQTFNTTAMTNLTIVWRQFPQQLTGQTHESSFRSRLCRAEYDWRLVNVFGHVATAYYEDLKTRDEPAFRANNNKKVVLCGHSTDDIITYRFLTSSVVDQSWIDTYIFAVITSGAPFGGAPMADGTLTQDCACLHWMIPNKNTFDDDCVVVRLKSDNVCKILMKNMTWTDNPAGKACVKTAVQRTRNNTDQPLVLPKVMTHVMYSIGINATAGVILNATRQRWTSDTHSDYYMDGDGTVPTVSLSSILQDAVPIARILDIIAQATAEEMEYDDSLNPPDFF
ncbi:hypothetical protein BLNAU_25010 [Blattamonas nauphoetae]|uniref:Uncharacterized protein n=2 Tax=Blattamonas nauphoetae TaxID=2049346 RepID=A0ABQ9WNM0_9EUKA|nr:hypothetical protein BLNAU_25010 [Blattamonas nauphoetae]